MKHVPYLSLFCLTTGLSLHPDTHAVGGWFGVGIWTGIIISPLLIKFSQKLAE